MIIKFGDTNTDPQEGRPLVLKRIINQSHTDSISLTWVTLFGRHEKVVNEISDRVYYIINGEADFEVGDNEKGSVTGGDVVLIPKGIPYVFEGHMTYVVMNSPGYVPDSDKVVP
jgi:mannose-6-phosphate isomerase-like protein (cupin superfamily)